MSNNTRAINQQEELRIRRCTCDENSAIPNPLIGSVLVWMGRLNKAPTARNAKAWGNAPGQVASR
ncbi:MAG TPA: hypothetical protein DC047_11860 [Blastocatellia bacterium]|nr:hypothetical protein [Blastocatellia bacterium]